jgi:catalase
LSMANTVKGNVKGRKVAIVVTDGVDGDTVEQVRQILLKAGAQSEVIATKLGPVRSATGAALTADNSFLTMASVMYDGVFVPGGQESIDALRQNGDAIHFVAEAFKHCKPVGATGEGRDLLRAAGIDGPADQGIVTAENGDTATAARQFVDALGQHRFFMRKQVAMISA